MVSTVSINSGNFLAKCNFFATGHRLFPFEFLQIRHGQKVVTGLLITNRVELFGLLALFLVDLVGCAGVMLVSGNGKPSGRISGKRC